EHPIAQAIVRGAAAELGGALANPERFENVVGKGVRGEIDGVTVLVGRAPLFADAGITPSHELLDLQREAEARGKTAVLVAWGGVERGIVIVGDEVKATSKEAIAQ